MGEDSSHRARRTHASTKGRDGVGAREYYVGGLVRLGRFPLPIQIRAVQRDAPLCLGRARPLCLSRAALRGARGTSVKDENVLPNVLPI